MLNFIPTCFLHATLLHCTNPNTCPGVLHHFPQATFFPFLFSLGLLTQHRDEEQQRVTSSTMGWLPRQYVWAHSRHLLSANVSCSHSLPPLWRNHCSETSQEFQIFEMSAWHRGQKLTNRFQSYLRVERRACKQIA